MNRHKLLNKYLENKPMLSDKDLETLFKALYSIDEEENYVFNDPSSLEKGMLMFF